MAITVPAMPDAAAPLVDSTGRMTSEWRAFFNRLNPAINAATTAVQELPPVDATLLHNNVSDTLSKGFLSTPFDNGSKSSGTFTVDGANGALQKVTIAGAVTFGLPADGTSVQLLVVMATGAAIPNISAFEFAPGEDFDAVVGNKFMTAISNIGGEGTISIVAGKGNT